MRPLEDLWRLSRKDPRMPAAGLHHFVHERGDEKTRLHLRIDSSGDGTLLVNADRVLHLNPTAAIIAHSILDGRSDAEIARLLSRQFRISNRQAEVDAADMRRTLDEIIRPDGACPVHELDLDIGMPFSARPSAPYRMDLALTYRCNNDCAHCYNGRPRDFAELDTDSWRRILDRLWDLGVPHIVFTGGEPTLRNDLPDLISHAEHLGQITGLNTNGRRLSDRAFVDRLVGAGLDHVQITLESNNPNVHNRMVGSRSAFEQTTRGVRNALESSLYVMTNTTMLSTNVESLPDTLEYLAELGVPTIGLNALIYSGKGITVGTGLHESQLAPLLDTAIAKTESHHQRLIWYTPTQYCEFDPTLHNLGVKGCTAALYSMCVEPNGDVLPCQSYYESLGNLLTDPWESIWEHPLASSLRERRQLASKCTGCSLLPACGGGCPLVALPAGMPEVVAPSAQLR